MRTSLANLLLAASIGAGVLSSGCEGGGGVGGPMDPADDPDDAGGGKDDGEDVISNCAVGPSYATLPRQEAAIDIDDVDGLYYALYAEIDGGSPVNELEVSLWPGYGAFLTADVTPGTYVLTGPETNSDDCGVCVRIYGDMNRATGSARQFYMAQSGTVKIDSLEGAFSGSLTEVLLREADEETSVPVEGGCQSRIPFARFSATIEPVTE